MFAALEVAEIHEALEQSRAANGEVPGPPKSKGAKLKGGGLGPGEAKDAKAKDANAKPKKRSKGQPGTQNTQSSRDWWSNGWSDSWNSGWWDNKSTARWQKRQAESEAAQRDA